MLKFRLIFLIAFFSIFGSLFAQEESPKIGIQNWNVEVLLSEDLKKGFLQIEAEFEGKPLVQKDEFRIDARLFRNHKQLKKIIIKSSKNSNYFRDELSVAYPDLWSAEYPNLYQLVLSLKDKNGTVLDSNSLTIGFREVKMLGGQLRINGKTISLKGVNLNNHNPKTEIVISRESMLEDIRLLKRLNANAVCASQYHKHPYWYQLCDKYGIYLIEVANVEIDFKPDLSSGNNSSLNEEHLNDKERFKDVRKNHPSIIIARNKNETTLVYNHSLDTVPSDFDFCNSASVIPGSKNYPALMELKKTFQPIAFELNNAFIKIYNNYDFTNLSNFDFEWQLLKDGLEIGKGNFPEINLEPHQSRDVPLPMNGELFSQDVEYVYSITAKTKEESELVPKHHEVAWEQFEVQSMRGFMFGNLDSFDELKIYENPWGITILGNDFQIQFSKETGKLERWKWSGKDILANEKGFSFNFWREMTDKDFGNRFLESEAVWKSAGENAILEEISMKIIDKKEVQIKTEHTLGNGIASWKTIYTIAANGELYVDNTFTPLHEDLPELPKLGLTLEIDSSFQHLDWYGRGPFETYWNRKRGAKIGVYSSSVDEQLVNYVRLHENHNHTDVRWFALRDSTGYGILVAAEPMLDFSAQNYSLEDFVQPDKYKNKHSTDVHKKPFVTLDIDFSQTGVAGENSRGVRERKEYKLFAKPYQYRFRMVPIHPKQIDLQKLWKEKPLLKSMED